MGVAASGLREHAAHVGFDDTESPAQLDEPSGPPSRPRTTRRSNYLQHFARLGVSAATLYVAFAHLSEADAAPDEYTYRSCAWAYLHGNFGCNREHPPLAKELIALVMGGLGNSIESARVAAGLAAVATAWFCYLLVRDRAGEWAGLFAGGLIGLLPQVGLEGSAPLEAIRVDRFALLDPFVGCFVAGALFALLRWTRSGGRAWPLLTGAMCAAAACSKATGALGVPVIFVVAGIAAHVKRRRALRELLMAGAGATLVGVASYAPFGPSGAVRAIGYMFRFQTTHPNREVLVVGHLYAVPPAWADAAFAFAGVGALAAIVAAVAAVVGLSLDPAGSLPLLGVAASIELGTGIGMHLSQPHYWVAAEPELITAGAIGISRMLTSRWHRPLAIGALAVLALAGVRTVEAVADSRPGPNMAVASAITCRHCVIADVGFADILVNYVPKSDRVVIGPPETMPSGVSVQSAQFPDRRPMPVRVVVIDSAALAMHPSWRRPVAVFELHAGEFGYRRVGKASRVTVYEAAAPVRIR